MKRYRLPAALLAVFLLAAGCGQPEDGMETRTAAPTGGSLSESRALETESSRASQETEGEQESGIVTGDTLPAALSQIPGEYWEASEHPGTLTELEYDTYESMTYESQEKVICKRVGQLRLFAGPPAYGKLSQ